MNETEKNVLKKRLLQYPGITEINVDKEIYIYEQREAEKKTLIVERGFNNVMAEAYLERVGYPRPPGWHSVFFYPGSYRPRYKIIFWLVVIIIAIWFFINQLK